MSKTAVARKSTICYCAMGWVMDSYQELILWFYNESLRLGFLPGCLKDSDGIIIVKPDRPDMFDPKNYYPLIIEDTLTKLIENIMA